MNFVLDKSTCCKSQLKPVSYSDRMESIPDQIGLVLLCNSHYVDASISYLKALFVHELSGRALLAF